jgi:lysophospholipid acyltransferase (LPLAT)-like uncharacterized protein
VSKPVDGMSILIGILGGWLARTWRVEVVHGEHLDRFREEGEPFVFALWHDQLLPLLWFHRGHPTAILASSHRDAKPLVTAARKWGFQVIVGSSTRGGGRALRQLVSVLRGRGEAAITPDGPTGPAHIAKRGVATAARLSGASILPVSASTDRFWRLNSWDRLRIPKPFARVRLVYGAPISAPESRSAEAEVLERVERALQGTST